MKFALFVGHEEKEVDAKNFRDSLLTADCMQYARCITSHVHRSGENQAWKNRWIFRARQRFPCYSYNSYICETFVTICVHMSIYCSLCYPVLQLNKETVKASNWGGGGRIIVPLYEKTEFLATFITGPKPVIICCRL